MTDCGRQYGFSLIELLVVIVVIGILAAVAMQSMTATVEDVRRIQTEREMDMLAEAIVGNPSLTQNGRRSDFGYVGDIGAFPPDLQALYKNPGGLGTWRGPYIPVSYTQDSTGFKLDEWGAAYTYAGGLMITSPGGGNPISKKIADAANDYLLNRINGTILDAANQPPGPVYDDSINVVITFPNGSGGAATKTYHPDSAGSFQLDSIPVGTHPLEIVYAPDADTLHRFLTVLPRHKNQPAFQLAFSFVGGGGGGGGSSSEILRPSGVGSQSGLQTENCGANWQCVDEVTADENGTYVKREGGSWRRDLYATQDHATGTGLIDSVVIRVRCRRTNPSSQIRTLIQTGGVQFSGATITPAANYTNYSTTYVSNPQTSAAWTWTEIDAIEIGVRLRGGARCTQVWIEVFYTF